MNRIAISARAARIVADNHITDYAGFLTENRKIVNRQFSFVLLLCAAVGPCIALGQRLDWFVGVSEGAAFCVTGMTLVVAAIHKLILLRDPASKAACLFALVALDAMLVIMDYAHCTINVVWFLVPLLSILFCDFKVYVAVFVVNYLSMVLATWLMAGYRASIVSIFATPESYFASRVGSLTLELLMLFVVGNILGRMLAGYYQGMVEKTIAHEHEHQAQERLSGELMSLADIYISAHDIDLVNDTFTEIICNKPSLSDMITQAVKAGSPDGSPHAQQTLYAVMAMRTAPRSQAEIRAFIDLSTLDERLQYRKTITQEFLNVDHRWVRGRFIASRRAVDGRLTHALWLVEDINIEKRGRDALIDMSQRAMAASEAKSAFLSNMSHEIRTPINAMLGMNEMILRECDDATILGYSENIQTAGRTLLGLVNDILDFSKIESGKMEIIPADYDLASALNDLVNMVQTRADAKGLALALEFDAGVPRWLRGDEVRVKQVITNLLTNAVKYTERGTVTFRIGYEKIADSPDDALIKVAVQDTGIGIKEEDLKKLFSEFDRIEEKRNRNIEGTGLGLSIAKNLLDMMGSSLHVVSEYGQGSTFGFAVKQRVVDWAPLGDFMALRRARMQAHREYRERFTAPSALVLVVDDNPMNLKVFKSLLKKTQVRIDMAASGGEGIRLTHEKKYDMIFLDHMMPGKDGIETLRELREESNNPNLHTPAICLTANAISGARERYMAMGFDDYLTKPIDSGKLEAMLMECLPPEKIEKVADAAPAPAAADASLPPAVAALGESQIDVAAGIKNSGAVAAYLPLLKIFYDTMDETAATLNRLYDEQDVKGYVIKVHALKSSARIIGATRFGEEAQKLEDAGKREDFAYIRAHHPEFMGRYRQFKGPLARALGADAAPAAKPEAAPEMLAAAYAEIRAAAEDMDSDRLESVVQEMAEFQAPAPEAELWARLQEAAGRYDYEALTALLAGAGKT